MARIFRRMLCVLVLWSVTVAGCSDQSDNPDSGAALQGEIAEDGVMLVGPAGTSFEGFVLEISPGAAATGETVTVFAGDSDIPLPESAHAVGPQFRLAGPTLSQPMQVTVPFESSEVESYGQDLTQVKVWIITGDEWQLTEPINVNTASGVVTVELNGWTTLGAGVKLD